MKVKREWSINIENDFCEYEGIDIYNYKVTCKNCAAIYYIINTTDYDKEIETIPDNYKTPEYVVETIFYEDGIGSEINVPICECGCKEFEKTVISTKYAFKERVPTVRKWSGYMCLEDFEKSDVMNKSEIEIGDFIKGYAGRAIITEATVGRDFIYVDFVGIKELSNL